MVLTVAILLFRTALGTAEPPNSGRSRGADPALPKDPSGQRSALPRIDVKDFGAKGDCGHVADGAMAEGSTTLTSATARFTRQDVDKPVLVLEAGVQAVPGLGPVAGAPLSSRIVRVQDAHTAVLADPARRAVSGVSVTWGTDDTRAIQRAIDSLAATGGTVFFPAGTYRVVYQGGPGLKVNASNIRLQGVGDASALFNSTVLFHAKVKDGVTYTEQMGVPVLYVGRPGRAIDDVEVDHLWLGDNGQKYDYGVWGPEGPGVLGSAGQVNRFRFHDLTIETHFLCGLNMDSQTKGFAIYNVTVRCSANHGFYLAGTASDGDVHDNRILGTTAPMRIGIAVKKKQHIRLRHNEVARVGFQGISVVGDHPSYVSRDVLIADNWIHDLTARHTDAITIFNAEDVTITGNRITDTSWIGIDLRTTHYTVARVVIKDNVLTRVGQVDPAPGIFAQYQPPPGGVPEGRWPGAVRDVTIENNVVKDSPSGIELRGVGGTNVVRGNRVENPPGAPEGRTGYRIEPLESSKTTFSKNVGVRCTRYPIAPHVVSSANDLK